MKKIIAGFVLGVLAITLYAIIFWVCPLFFSSLCTPPILNVVVMHIVFSLVMGILFAIDWAIKVVLK